MKAELERLQGLLRIAADQYELVCDQLKEADAIVADQAAQIRELEEELKELRRAGKWQLEGPRAA